MRPPASPRNRKKYHKGCCGPFYLKSSWLLKNGLRVLRKTHEGTSYSLVAVLIHSDLLLHNSAVLIQASLPTWDPLHLLLSWSGYRRDGHHWWDVMMIKNKVRRASHVMVRMNAPIVMKIGNATRGSDPTWGAISVLLQISRVCFLHKMYALRAPTKTGIFATTQNKYTWVASWSFMHSVKRVKHHPLLSRTVNA